MSAIDLLVVAAAGVAAGFVNAVAGGGTLISFPALTAVGLPIVSANVTSTVSLSPGYVGGAYAQRDSVRAQGDRLRVLAPAGALGGLLGGVLLLATGDELLERLIPFLILFACALLAGQDRVRSVIERRRTRPGADPTVADHGLTTAAVAMVFLASIYGGYFGAGLGIVFLAVLGVFLPDDLTDVNALKQAMSVVVNVTASLFFVFSGKVWWGAALVMAFGALLGGNLGGRLAGRLDPKVFRWLVIGIGVVVAIVYALR